MELIQGDIYLINQDVVIGMRDDDKMVVMRGGSLCVALMKTKIIHENIEVADLSIGKVGKGLWSTKTSNLVHVTTFTPKKDMEVGCFNNTIHLLRGDDLVRVGNFRDDTKFHFCVGKFPNLIFVLDINDLEPVK